MPDTGTGVHALRCASTFSVLGFRPGDETSQDPCLGTNLEDPGARNRVIYCHLLCFVASFRGADSTHDSGKWSMSIHIVRAPTKPLCPAGHVET